MRWARPYFASIAATTVVHEGERIPLTASFGVASAGWPAEADLERLLREADRALYRAKSEGRNRVEVEPVQGG